MKYTYYKYRTKLNIIKKDLRDKFPISFFKKVGLWRKGFLAEKYTLYQFDKTYHLLEQSHLDVIFWALKEEKISSEFSPSELDNIFSLIGA